MNIRQLNPAEGERVRREWIEAVQKLVEDVRAWSKAQNWETESVNHILTEEEPLGTYTVPGLEIKTLRGQLELEPIGRNVLGAEGRVDLYARPTFYRVMLLPAGNGNWVVRTDSGLDWPQPWGEATFVAVAEGLLSAPCATASSRSWHRSDTTMMRRALRLHIWNRPGTLWKAPSTRVSFGRLTFARPDATWK